MRRIAAARRPAFDGWGEGRHYVGMKSSITTRVGDRGTTRLYSGEEVPKHDLRIEAAGAVDEVVSALGVARATATRASTREAIERLQRELFLAGSEFATVPARVTGLRPRIDAARVRTFERRRRTLERRVDHPAGFILPGASETAAHLDLARAIARRLERRATELSGRGDLANPHLLVWLNRLSDYLWLLARSEEEFPTLKDAPWTGSGTSPQRSR